jgi:tRNA nucleotidyltransferase (CCA-adding enzyme)
VNFPAPILQVLACLSKHNAKPILVGGAVRDHLLGFSIRDWDIEVYGVSSLEQLKTAVAPLGTVKEVGKAFGILHVEIDGLHIDLSLPRRDNKIGKGHVGFEAEIDGTLTFQEASKRRDFTINSMGMDLARGEILDPWGGKKDLENRILRHVSPAFIEDPLRVLRAIQLSARFNRTVAPETVTLCKTITPTLFELPKERLYKELKTLLLRSQNPSIGLNTARDLYVLHLFPELAALIGIPQDPKWHAEGDVWIHTCRVVDEMAKRRTGNEQEDWVLMLAAVCHDMGKPNVTRFENGRWRSLGHETAGVTIAKKFLKRFTDETQVIDQVLALVKHHMIPSQLFQSSLKQKVSDKAIKSLALRVNTDYLCRLAEADYAGRETIPSSPKTCEAVKWLKSRLKTCGLTPGEKPQAIVNGRDLINLGFDPGASFGPLLKQCFEAQLEGKIVDLESGITWIKQHIRKSGHGKIKT